MSELLFDDIFNVVDLDPDGKKYDLGMFTSQYSPISFSLLVYRALVHRQYKILSPVHFVSCPSSLLNPSLVWTILSDLVICFICELLFHESVCYTCSYACNIGGGAFNWCKMHAFPKHNIGFIMSRAKIISISCSMGLNSVNWMNGWQDVNSNGRGIRYSSV